MSQMPSVINVKKLYTQSFLELTEFHDKILTATQEEEFSQLVELIYARHSKVLVQMARGAYEFRDAIRMGQFRELDATGSAFDQMEATHEFLDRFYLCRIGIRVLIGQYLALRQPPVDNYIGIICSQTSPYEIVKRAIDDASFMCTRKYGDAPEVIISGRLEQTFPYVPTHLRTYNTYIPSYKCVCAICWLIRNLATGFCVCFYKSISRLTLPLSPLYPPTNRLHYARIIEK